MQDVPRLKIQERRKHLFKLLDLQSNSNFCLLENGGKRHVWIQTQSTLSGAEMVLSQKAPPLGAPTNETDHSCREHACADTDPRRRRVGCVHMLIPHGMNTYPSVKGGGWQTLATTRAELQMTKTPL